MPKKQPATPYRTRPGEDPIYLADRHAYKARFEEYLEEGSHVRLVGARGTGKSVLLTHYGEWAKKADWIPVDLVLKDDFRDEDKFRTEFREALLKGKEQISQIRGFGQKAKDVWANIEPELMLGVPGFVQLGGKMQKNAKPRSLASSFTIALTQLGKLADDAGRGIILLCDEAHTLPKERLTALLGAVNYTSVKENLPIMLVIAGLPVLRLQAHQADGSSGRLFEAELVDKLDTTRKNGGHSEAALALIIPAEKTDIHWDPDAAEIVATDIEGYPYFIQFYGQRLWRAAARDNGRKLIDEPFYVELRDTIKDRLAEKIYEETFDEAGVGSVDQDFLEAAGYLGTEVFDIGKVKALLGRTEDAIQNSKGRLIGIGIIYKIGQGTYKFSLPGFGDFLRNRHPHRPD